MKRKVALIFSAAVLGAGVLATNAFANTTPPTTTGQTATAAEHRGKAFDRLNDVLTALVQKGVITAQQKDAILDAVKAAGHRDVDARQFVGKVVEASSDYLGIPVKDLRTQLKAGKSLGEIANATPGKSRDGLIDTLDKAADARIKAAVDAGKITADRAEELRPKVHALIEKIVDHKRPTPVAAK